jgi:hypothetical protein
MFVLSFVVIGFVLFLCFRNVNVSEDDPFMRPSLFEDVF